MRAWSQNFPPTTDTSVTKDVSHISRLSSYLDVAPAINAEPTELDAAMLMDLHEVIEGNSTVRLSFKEKSTDSSDFYGFAKKRWRRRMQFASCVLVIANIIFMTCALTLNMQKAWEGSKEDGWILILDVLFAVLFAAELVMRLSLEGRAFFLVRWNVFDFLVIALSICEVLLELLFELLSFVNFSWLRMIRIIRVFRAARILQVGGWFRECRLIMDSVGRGILPITFVFLAIFSVLFLTALGLAQVIESNIQDDKESREIDNLRPRYGSLWLCMYTLFQAVSGGEAWAELLKPLESLGQWHFRVFFCLYIVCLKFGILSILLGVIVCFVSGMEAWEESLATKAEATQMQTAIDNFRQILVDKSREDSTISYRSFEKVLAGNGRHLPKLLGLETASLLNLFRLMDTNGSDRVSVDRLICGLVEIKQNPARFHSVTLMYESQRIMCSINRLSRDVERQFARIVVDRVDRVGSVC